MTAFAPAIARPAGARSRIAFDVISVVAGSLVVAGLAQISITLHFTPVPITGQTLGVLLVGGALGATRGGASFARRSPPRRMSPLSTVPRWMDTRSPTPRVRRTGL